MNTTIRNLIFILVLALIGVACDNSSTGSDNDREPARVEGQVENMNSSSEKTQPKSVEGAIVTAAHVTSNGEIEPIGNAETETDAEGRFTLEIDADEVTETSDRLVIMAESNGKTAKTFVTAEVESGTTAEVQPISFESSAETDIYQEITANGDADVVTKADIEATVNTSVAQDIESNVQNAAALAAALASQAKAKAEFYSEQGIEVTEDQMNNIREIKAQAQLELESQLNAASDSSDKTEAFNSFLETVAKAESEAEVNATATAKASESSSRILVQNSADLSTEAKAEIRKHAAYTTSFAIETAVQAQMEAANTSESAVESVSDAAVSLRTDIKAMSSASKEDVKAAFEAFNSEVEAIVQNDTEIDGELFISANSSINEGPKASLESALETSLSISNLVDAYTTFYSEVGSIVESTFSNAGDAEAEAYAEILILINIAS